MNKYDLKGKKQGYWEEYFSYTKQIWCKGNFVDDQKEGFWEYFNINDGEMMKVHFVNGEYKGYFERYNDEKKWKGIELKSFFL